MLMWSLSNHKDAKFSALSLETPHKARVWTGRREKCPFCCCLCYLLLQGSHCYSYSNWGSPFPFLPWKLWFPERGPQSLTEPLPPRQLGWEGGSDGGRSLELHPLTAVCAVSGMSKREREGEEREEEEEVGKGGQVRAGDWEWMGNTKQCERERKSERAYSESQQGGRRKSTSSHQQRREREADRGTQPLWRVKHTAKSRWGRRKRGRVRGRREGQKTAFLW